MKVAIFRTNSICALNLIEKAPLIKVWSWKLNKDLYSLLSKTQSMFLWVGFPEGLKMSIHREMSTQRRFCLYVREFRKSVNKKNPTQRLIDWPAWNDVVNPLSKSVEHKPQRPFFPLFTTRLWIISKFGKARISWNFTFVSFPSFFFGNRNQIWAMIKKSEILTPNVLIWLIFWLFLEPISYRFFKNMNKFSYTLGFKI